MELDHNTLQMAQDIESAGLEREPAEAISRAIHQHGRQLATKADVEQLGKATKADVERLRRETWERFDRLERRILSLRAAMRAFALPPLGKRRQALFFRGELSRTTEFQCALVGGAAWRSGQLGAKARRLPCRELVQQQVENRIQCCGILVPIRPVGPANHQGELALGNNRSRCRLSAQVIQRFPVDAFMQLGHFTDEDRAAPGAECLANVLKRSAQPMNGLVENQRLRNRLKLLKTRPPGHLSGRQKPLEAKPVGRKAGNGQSGDGGAGAGQRSNADARTPGLAHQPHSRIADSRRASVAKQEQVLSLAHSLEELRNPRALVVGVQGHQAGAGAHALKQSGSAARVFRRYLRGLAQGGLQPRANIAEVANWSGGDNQGPRSCWRLKFLHPLNCHSHMITYLPGKRRANRRSAGCAPAPMLRARIAALASLAILALAGCATGDRMAASSEELAALEEQALALSRTGDYEAARQVYLSMVRRASDPGRNRYRILAAREAGRGGQHRRSLEELLAIEPLPRWLALWSLATSASERVLTGPQAAYDRLAGIDAQSFPDVAGDLIRTRSELLFALRKPAEALGELTRLGADFSEGDDSAAGFTWSLLRDYRAQLSTAGVTGAALGWVELALLADRLARDPVDAGAALDGWREKFSDHPAVSLLANTVRPEVCEGTRAPARLAMLLPGSQPYGVARQSLRDGFLAARYALLSSCATPEVAFYEVADSDDAATQWTRAAAEGAEFIVGPLLPNSVESVAEVAGELPTLALNRLRGRMAPDRFEEFALAPEHEARQAARHAIQRGLHRALALYPRTAWGQRIYRSFLDEYQAAGGRLIAREQYSPTAVDYSEQIGRLLKIGPSNRRARELEVRLGRNLGFQPRRRQDADLVFVVARAAQGQLLVPQLRYNYSGDLPVFSTHSIYDPGHPDNRDLNGLEMPILPILTHQHVQFLHGQLNDSMLAESDFNVSLFAMGYDSFKLALALYNGPEALTGGIQGLTGTIYRAPGGSLERELAWTQIVDGQPGGARGTAR